MITLSDILGDIQRGILAHNMNEDKFTYRITYFVYEDGKEKHCIDTRYDGVCQALKNIIRGNLTTTNTVVIAAVTTLKNGKCISLLSRSYPFCLDGYFQKICKEKVENINSNYGRRVAQWC